MPTKTEPDSFELRYPPLVLFGWGKRAALTDVLRGITANARVPGVLLVCTRSAARNPGLEFWRALCEGRVVAEHVGVPHDPPLETVDRLAAKARDHAAEAVVAVGGGSVLDVAKAAAVLATSNEGITAWFSGRWAPSRSGLPVVALPTTAGTGAEITRNAVLTDPERRIKRSVRAPFMIPQAAICDPELTVTMPPELTAASGLDALTQAIESYVSIRANTVTRALAAEAVKLLLNRLPAAFCNGADVGARTAVAKASLLSALSFSQSGLGAAHGLGHPIGALLSLPHGLTCGILLPHILDWNAPECGDRLEALAAESGHPSPTAFIARVRALVADVGLPPDFRELGLMRSHFPHIIANCRSGSMRANPRPMSDRDIEEFLTPLARI
ncbi:MAG: iron-containing alcohol dehydrogenase [Kiritimatiellaeota bacterium]|nr:iron-containing alcohol dehydrogenase [Kiritimatiellota bacterium]